MLPAVYCGLESSALPYNRTWQKPANETGLQGIIYRPCWCFRLLKRTLQKKKMEMLSQGWMSLKLHQSAPSERMKESMGWMEREKEGKKKRKNILSYIRRWMSPWYRLSERFRGLKSTSILILVRHFLWYSHMVHVKTTWKNSDRIFLTQFYAPEWPSTVSQSTCSPSSRAR